MYLIVLKIKGLEDREIDFPQKEKRVEPIEKSRLEGYKKNRPKEPNLGGLVDITV